MPSIAGLHVVNLMSSFRNIYRCVFDWYVKSWNTDCQIVQKWLKIKLILVVVSRYLKMEASPTAVREVQVLIPLTFLTQSRFYERFVKLQLKSLYHIAPLVCTCHATTAVRQNAVPGSFNMESHHRIHKSCSGVIKHKAYYICIYIYIYIFMYIYIDIHIYDIYILFFSTVRLPLRSTCPHTRSTTPTPYMPTRVWSI